MKTRIISKAKSDTAYFVLLKSGLFYTVSLHSMVGTEKHISKRFIRFLTAWKTYITLCDTVRVSVIRSDFADSEKACLLSD